MNLGLNLSFAVKRWQEPDILAKLVQKMGVTNIQFTWDLVDPWWPADVRDAILDDYRLAFEAVGIAIDANFGGLAAYSFPNLLGADARVRAMGEAYFRRAIDMTVRLGAKIMGTPLGGMSNKEAFDKTARQERYDEVLQALFRLADYGKSVGLEEIHIEATPLYTEFPHSPSASLKLMEDLQGSAIPIKLLIDWGHAIYQPLLGAEADIDLWFATCREYIGSIHLQQADGLGDRHWDFTDERGVITPEMILEATKKAGLDDVPQYVEVVTAPEDTDEHVLDGMLKTMEILHEKLGV